MNMDLGEKSMDFMPIPSRNKRDVNSYAYFIGVRSFCTFIMPIP
jgi:hypothetical protein